MERRDLLREQLFHQTKLLRNKENHMPRLRAFEQLNSYSMLRRGHSLATDSAKIVIKTLEGVSDKWKAHLGGLLDTSLLGRGLLCLEDGGVVGLVDLVRGEVRGINTARKSRLKRSSDPAKRVELDATEKVVALELSSTTATKTILSVADQAMNRSALSSYFWCPDRTSGSERWKSYVPSDQILCLGTQLNIIWEVQALPPVHNLAIRVVAVFGAERRPADQALEHDCSQAPPIAVETVPMAREDLGRDIIGCANRRVRHQSPAPSPVVNLCAIRNRQVDLVDGNGRTVAGLVRLALQKLLVIVVVMQLVETSRQTEISQLDMTTAVQKNVVGLDVSAVCISPVQDHMRCSRPHLWIKPSLWTASMARTISAI